MQELMTIRRIRSFVRREGKMTLAQKQALEQQWPDHGLEVGAGFIGFPKMPLILEIGFGMGMSLFELAQTHLDKQFIGIEVYRPGVGALLRKLKASQLTNVKVFKEDAVDVLTACIPDHSLAALLLFFPDPWHKKRHHKRRLVQPEFVKLIKSKLKPGGYFHVATDWQPYAEHVDGVMQLFPEFQKTRPSAFLERPNTKYEKRGVSLGHEVFDLVYVHGM